MKSIYILLIIFLISFQFNSISQLKISDGLSIVVNGGETFYDAGGAAGVDGNTNQIITLKPANTGEAVCVDFNMFNTYFDGSLNSSDRLNLYDGNTNATLNIGSLTGNYSLKYSNASNPKPVGVPAIGSQSTVFTPTMFCATNPTGTITLEFINADATTSPGFEAKISTYKLNASPGCTINLLNDKSTICSGESIKLTASGLINSASLNCDFNNSTIGTGWASTASASFTSNVCNSTSLDNSIYLWMQNAPAPRTLATNSMNVLNGGTISFEYRQATYNGLGDSQTGASPCEAPDLTSSTKPEGIYVQYSTDAGSTWNTFKYLYPHSNSDSYNGCGPYVKGWTKMTYPIPTAAKTTSTQFRWIQEIVTSANADNWGLDNVSITAQKPFTISIYKNPVDANNHGTLISSSTNSPYEINESPTTNTTYRAVISDGTTSCYKDVTITVNSCCTPPVVSPTPTNPSCTKNDGQIKLSGLNNNTKYSISYKKDNVSVTASDLTSDGSGNIIIAGLSNGIYTDIICSLNGCSTIGVNSTLINPTPISITSSKSNPTTCNGTDGKITLSGLTNGKIYALSYVKDATPTTSTFTASGTTYDISNLGKGAYTKINVTNAGCTSNDETQTLVDPSGITITSTKTGPTSCSGSDGKITLSGLTNGKIYALSYVKDAAATPTTSTFTASGTTYDISNLGKGAYTKINVTNAGCTSNDETQTLIDPSGILITSSKNDPTICGGMDGSITISGLTNGNTYSLSYVKNNTSTINSTFAASGTTYEISNLGKGVYSKIHVIESGCASNDEIQTIINPAGPASPKANLTQPTCTTTTGKIEISAPLGNYNYSIDGTNFQVSTVFNSLTANTTYKIIVQDLGGCKDSSNFKIDTILSTPSNAKFTLKHASCISSTGFINVTSPIGSFYTYSIDGTTFQTTTSFTNLNPGNYTLTTKNLSGCSNTNSITIKTPPSPPSKPFAIVKQPNCDSVTGTITVVNPTGNNYSYSLDNLNYQNSPKFSSKPAGNYTYYVRDTTLCFSSNTITVQPQPILPIASFSYTPTTDLTIINTQIVFSNNSLNATTYKWNFDDDSKFSTDKNPTHDFPGIANIYVVKLTAYNAQCSDDTTMMITIIEKPIIYIPNSFTPNMDEINNSFVPVIGGGISPDNYSMYIFNRWGTLLFESHNKDIGWDGSYGNKICPSDTYIWKIEYKESAGSKLRKQLVGHVNLIN